MGRRLFFPDPRNADSSGLVAITREIRPDLLLEAYGRGIFPWSEHPVRWYSPDPRAIFLLDRTPTPKKVGKLMRRQGFRVSFDQAFEQVMEGCAEAHRDDGQWISEGFFKAYGQLHRMGYAHSVEVWVEDALVGGLYGVHLGGMFAGESMFHRVSNASKIAFAYLLSFLRHIGVPLIDAQVLNEHTYRLGALLIHRDDFLELLPQALSLPVHYVGVSWPADPPVHPAGIHPQV